MPRGDGLVLDVGPMSGFVLSVDALAKGHRVVAVGLEHLDVPDGVRYIRRDILSVNLEERFDYVLNASTTEHIGLGRYGDPIGGDFDLQAMKRLWEWTKPGGRQYLTVPVGRDAVVGEYHRVYGWERLPRLLEGYRVVEQAYYAKPRSNEYEQVSKQEAMAVEPVQPPVDNIIELYYAIGCFVLCRE